MNYRASARAARAPCCGRTGPGPTTPPFGPDRTLLEDEQASARVHVRYCSTDLLGRRPTALFLLYQQPSAAYNAERPTIWLTSDTCEKAGGSARYWKLGLRRHAQRDADPERSLCRYRKALGTLAAPLWEQLLYQGESLGSHDDVITSRSLTLPPEKRRPCKNRCTEISHGGKDYLTGLPHAVSLSNLYDTGRN